MLAFIHILLCIFSISLFAVEETALPEVTFVWGSGYFGHTNLRPIGASDENLAAFSKSVHGLLALQRANLTLITTREDYVFSQGKVPDEYRADFDRLRPIFLEDIIEVLEGSEMATASDMDFSRQCALQVRAAVKSPAFVKISEDFARQNGTSLRSLQEFLEERGAIPVASTVPYMPNYIGLPDEHLLRYHIAFFLSQALKDRGNPAYTSDMVRFLYPLFCNRECPYIYVDIDTLTEIMKKPDDLSGIIERAHTGTSADAKLFSHPKGRIDLVVRNIRIDEAVFEQGLRDMFVNPISAFRQAMLAYFYSATVPFLTGDLPLRDGKHFAQRVKPFIDFIQAGVLPTVLGAGYTQTNIANDYKLFSDIVDGIEGRDRKSDESAEKATSVSTNSTVVKYLPASDIYFLSAMLAENMPLPKLADMALPDVGHIRSGSWGSISMELKTKVDGLLTRLQGSNESISDEDLCLLFSSYLHHDYVLAQKDGYMGPHIDALRAVVSPLLA